jgi:hypothetical protein
MGAYLGQRMYECNRVPFNWARTELQIISGDGPNVCGHVIIRAGSYYFHIDGIWEYPWSMDETGFKKNCRPNTGFGASRTTIAPPLPKRSSTRVVRRYARGPPARH